MKKILFYTNIPSPYRVDFFNELGKYCELTVLFETASSTERDKSWENFRFDNFRGIILNGVRTHLDRAFCPDVIGYLKRERYDHIFITIMASATAMLAVTYLKVYHIPYFYEGDGAILEKTGGVRGVKAALKRYIISSAEKCFSTGKDFDEYCMAYGAKRDNIVRFPLSSVFKKDVLTVRSVDVRNEIRHELGVETDRRILLGIGRFARIKGWDILFKAAEALDEKWDVMLIGGADTPENRKIIGLSEESKLRCKVSLIDFIPHEMVMKYMQAADVFVLPSRYDPWGLVINEAMACGLCCVSSDMCVAGREMIRHGENGFLFESENADALSGILKQIDQDFGVSVKTGEAALETACAYTIEAMARAHLSAVL